MNRFISSLGVLWFLVVLIYGIAPEAVSKDAPGNTRPNRLNRLLGLPASTMININNVAGWIKNDGESANNFATGNSGVFYPRGVTAGAIFQDGIVWGGRVNDGGSQVLRVGGQTYSSGMVGGRIISAGVAADPNAADVRIYRVRKNFHSADLRQDAAELNNIGTLSVSDAQIAAVRDQYRTDWIEWPTDQGAPFYDADSDGVYTPGFNADGSPRLAPLSGETYDVTRHADEPGIANADQVIWFVCNDLNPGVTNALYGSNPIGLELQVTLWGYDRTDPLANVYFKKFTFIYKGTATAPSNATITDMYAGQWSDPDLGAFGDDFVGCDTVLSMAYVYNSAAVDNQYAAFGLAPPAIGYDFLQGPIVAGAPTDTAVFNLKRRPGFRNLPMTAAFYFAAGGVYSDPPFSYEGAIQWYNLLRGLTPIDGTPFTHPAVPGATKFWLDGDPVTGSGRVDGVIEGPSDRRFGLCTGPFTMALGDTQEIVVGVVGGIAGNYLQSVTVMKNNDAAVQNAYNDLFDLPTAPPSPKLAIVQLDQRVVLDWGVDDAAVHLSEDFDRKGYTFQGYNVYQLPSASATLSQAIKLGTFDVIDGVRTIFDDVFNPNLGIVERIIKQVGTDAGVRRLMEITRDEFRSFPLVNGQRYYFAVTSYGYNPDPTALTHALESSLQIVTAIPQSPLPGVRPSSSFGDTLQVDHSAGTSDGSTTVVVVDPSKTTGHNYQVSFTVDTVNGGYLWHATDVSTSSVVLTDQKNQSGDNAYSTVAGLQVVVQGPPLQGKSFSYASASPANISPVALMDYPEYEGGRWFTGGSHGGELFFGGVFLEPNFWGATTVGPADYKIVELRFRPMASYTDLDGNGQYTIGEPYVVDDPSQTQKAFMYRTFSGAAFRGFFDIPFTAWDVTDPANPRQVNVVVRDRDQNSQWDLHNLTSPPNPALPNNGDQQFNYTWILNTTYDPTGTMYGNGTGGSIDFFSGPGDAVYDAMWAIWVDDRHNGGMLAEQSTFTLVPNFVNNDADVFSWAAPAAVSFDASAARADVSQLNVFPNPYYGFNRAETSKFARFVTFNHMPPRAEIRIFNLAGALVKSIMKDDATQFTTWDLTNSSGLPVASGLYIVYVNMPDIGATKTLKVIIIQEQQFLDYF